MFLSYKIDMHIYVDYILAVVDPWGGGGGFKKQCSVKNVFCQYLYAIQPYKIRKYRVLQKSSKHCFISIFFHLGRRDTPSLFHPRSLLRVSSFGVLQKSSKHFLISIFFPPGERGTTPPCPTRSVQFCS